MTQPWSGGFETQRREATTTLDVEGSLPSWLAGTYLLNGPGQFEVGDRPLGHWFDALAMVRRFRIDDGSVTYANRFVDSADYAFAREHGRVRRAFPGTPPDRPVWTRLRQTLTGAFLDNPAIGFVRIGGHVLAVTESPTGLELDPETLAVVGRHDLTAGLDVDATLAHQHHAPEESAFYNLGVDYGRESGYTLFRRPDAWADGPADPTPLTRIRIDREYVPYVHSFALTERYAVLPLCPFGVDTGSLLTGALTGGTFLDAFEGFDDPASFVVLDRRDGRHVATVEADPFFVYHHANAFEVDAEGDPAAGSDHDAEAVVVDCVVYPDERALTRLTLANLRSADPAVPAGDLVRFRVPLSGGAVERRRLRAGPLEFPTIDYRQSNGRPYDVAWVAEGGDGPLPGRLSRVSLAAGTARSYDPGDQAYPGEGVFVPHPDPDAADDGLLLSVVLDAGADRSVLVVLDAATMTERARVPLPHRLPYAFHGQFYADDRPGRSMN